MGDRKILEKNRGPEWRKWSVDVVYVLTKGAGQRIPSSTVTVKIALSQFIKHVMESLLCLQEWVNNIVSEYQITNVSHSFANLQPWFCRKCESQERPTRVRCELCPSRDGALKRTDNQGWAHVVCALYIPEVRFGNVSTMEPIILQLIPSERYSRSEYRPISEREHITHSFSYFF